MTRAENRTNQDRKPNKNAPKDVKVELSIAVESIWPFNSTDSSETILTIGINKTIAVIGK
jgi:hypothetical protein